MNHKNIWRIVYAAVTAVAAWAFVTSYAHIYDLGLAHAQHGIAAKGLPLTVDLLIVAASLILYADASQGVQRTGLARFMPRLMLWAGIAATVAANMAYGLPSGWLSALISAWPGAVFAGLAETVMVTARPAARAAGDRRGSVAVPSDSVRAAEASMAATVAAGNPLSVNQLQERFGLTRPQATKVRRDHVASLNGTGHE